MAYQRRQYKFTFADPDLDGLEVVTRPMSLDQMLGMAEDIEALQAGSATKLVVAKLADALVSCLVSWTVEGEDGQPAPLPATGAELLSEDARLTMAVMTEWIERVKVAPPLPGSSSDGVTSALELSMPMEPLLPSRKNSRVPG